MLDITSFTRLVETLLAIVVVAVVVVAIIVVDDVVGVVVVVVTQLFQLFSGVAERSSSQGGMA